MKKQNWLFQIEVLPEIVQAAGDKVEVYLDGGVTRGTDVLKALALGAKMVRKMQQSAIFFRRSVKKWGISLTNIFEQVFMGRPMLWGLACGGEEGAKAILEILRSEIDQTFALTG